MARITLTPRFLTPFHSRSSLLQMHNNMAAGLMRAACPAGSASEAGVWRARACLRLIMDVNSGRKVPYAEKWQKETDKLRKIAIDCDLNEELKWGKSCFTFLKKNVAIIIPLKESCAFSFFKGALLKDPSRILQKVGEHTQAGRWIKFTSVKEITPLQSTLRDYLYEAIALEESGKKVELKKASEYTVPVELDARLKDDPTLKASFEALTPGRRKSYIFHISSARQAATREARVLRCVPMILSGRGFKEQPR
jgi:uncharacterized protein YdeI (YjbR/CyaY-like superfamily)